MSKVIKKIAASKETSKGKAIDVTRSQITGNRKRKAKSEEEPVTSITIAPSNKVVLSTKLRPTATSNKSGKRKETISKQCPVIYLGHIPEGFEENEMKQFFNQIGKVLRVKMFRSLRTRKSQGYAFIEFEDTEVAQIAASSMNGYFIGDRKLVSHVLPHFNQKLFTAPKIKETANKDEEAKIDDEAKLVTGENITKIKTKVEKEKLKKQQKLQALGLDIDLGASIEQN
jgi:nucleolar protein 15